MALWENGLAIIFVYTYAIAPKSAADVGGFAKMNIRMLRRIVSTVPVLLLFAVNAFGVNPNPRISISAGGSVVKGDRTFVVDGDNFSSSFVDGGKGRVRGTLDLTKKWSLEATYSHGRNNQRILELGDTPIQRDFGMKLNQVDLNFVHFFAARKSPVRPFLTSGIGSLRFSPTSEAKALALSDEFIDDPTQLVSTRKLTVAFGGGIEARFSRWLGLRFDVKDYISAVPRFGVPQTSSSSGGIFFPVDGILHNIEIGVGIVFFLLPKQ